MNYNYNQYGQYPYNNYSYQPQMSQQTQYIPLTFVSGIEGAKAFIVTPNQTVYLRDSDSDLLYIKSADNQGRYSLKIYNLVPVEDKKTINNQYASTEALNALRNDFEERLKKLSLELEKLNVGPIGGNTNE